MPTQTRAATAARRTAPLPYDHIRPMLDGWAVHLKSRNRADTTISSYLRCANAMLAFLAAKGMPQTTEGIAREHVEAFIADLLERVSPATAAKHYRSLQQLFVFLVDDGEMEHSPMERMKPPTVQLKLVPVIPEGDYNKLLAACKGTTFEGRRDIALITFLYDCGCRAGEIIGMKLDDYDPARKLVMVVGKGGHPRNVGVADETTAAFRRYLRWRQRQEQATRTDAFWIGRKGALTVSGIAQILERRCDDAKVPHMHPHQFRHTLAHNWLADGRGSETDLMSHAGWRSRDMLTRYGRSAAAERAQAAHQLLSPADRAAKKRRR